MAQRLLGGTEITRSSIPEQIGHLMETRFGGWASDTAAFISILLNVFGAQHLAASEAQRDALARLNLVPPLREKHSWTMARAG
jgi:hypothetical protein